MNRPDASVLPWSNVYGLARTLIALSTLSTLLVNDPSLLWIPAAGIPEAPLCSGATSGVGLFCLQPQSLGLVRWVAIAVLALVASGWRPRFTGILHWWVTHSFVSTALLVDGGDQLSATLTLLLVPLTLTDGRRWHWAAASPVADTTWGNLRVGLATATLWVLRLQVAVVYLNAAASKWSAKEWMEGTALYYWFSDPAFGFTPPLRAVFGGLLENSFTVTLMTWGVLAFEFALFGALFARSRLPRRILLAMGIAFHTGIAFVHGLPSFVVIMFGALILLLRREDEPFAVPAWPRRLLARIRVRMPRGAGAAPSVA
jgi:antimicrobial peptide system SdpB family protein